MVGVVNLSQLSLQLFQTGNKIIVPIMRNHVERVLKIAQSFNPNPQTMQGLYVLNPWGLFQIISQFFRCLH